MKVYVVTSLNFLCIICLSEDSLKKYFEELLFDTKGNWANMNVTQMQAWISNLGYVHIIHEVEAI